MSSTTVSSSSSSAAAPTATGEDEPPSGRTGPEFHFVKTVPTRGHCVIKSEGKWYAAAAATSSATDTAAAAGGTTPEPAAVNLAYWLPKIEKYAQQAWDLEIKNYEEARKKGG